MAADPYSHTEYVDAFTQFMHTGEKDQLSQYLNNSRPDTFLSVYRNGFIRASASALESNFPSVVKLWGEDYFAQIANAYVNIAPASSATLLGYGFDVEIENDSIDKKQRLSFIQFLQQELSELIEQYPYVLDLYRLDQAWSEALNENGDSFLTLDAVQQMIAEGVDLGELPLTLVDSSRLVALEFDIFELWGQLRFAEINQDNEKPIELNAQANTIIFWQMDWQVQAKPLTVVEATFLNSLKLSKDFDIATTEATAIADNFDLSTLFAELLQAQLLQQ